MAIKPGNSTKNTPSYQDASLYLAKNENGDAELFEKLHQGEVVFDHQVKEWYIWKGNFWEPDKTRDIYNFVVNSVANYYLLAAQQSIVNKSDFARRAAQLDTRNRAENILFLAATKDGIKLKGDEWDSDPLIFGVGNGVIDLRNGTFRKAQPMEYIKGHSPVEWVDLQEPAPNWEKFLEDIFGNDAEVISFIQRLFGYCITGLTRDAILPIMCGSGRNGKTTLLEVLSKVMGDDYTMATPAEALMFADKRGERPQPYIFALQGKRLVWASESQDGAKLDGGLIKQLTGSDTINTRTLHKEPVKFIPTHKIMLITNHKPHVETEDQAMWDRVKLIEFNSRFIDDPDPKIPTEKPRDANIREKLLSEKSGILAWLVRGCLAWQQQGLNPPAKVKYSTESYRDEEDSFKEFVSDQCLIGQGSTLVTTAYNFYQQYSKINGLVTLTPKKFKEKMNAKFGDPKRQASGMCYQGVTVLSTLPTP